MSKYLFFIILGIILFLYINSIEGLNIGESCEDESECNREKGDTCGYEGPNCICNNGICLLSEIEDKVSPIYNACAKLIAPSEPEPEPEPESEIILTDFHTITPQMINHDHNENPSNCIYHESLNISRIRGSDIPCNLNDKFRELNSYECTFSASYNEDSNYETNGYEKINALVEDVNRTDGIFQQYLDKLNSKYAPNLYDSTKSALKGTLLTPDIMVNNLSFSEYLLKLYIENKEVGKVKMIDRGIFYCNGKLFYFHFLNSTIRVSLPRDIEPEEMFSKSHIEFLLSSNDNRSIANKYYAVQYNPYSAAMPQIHIDFPFEKLDRGDTRLTNEQYDKIIDPTSVLNTNEQRCKKFLQYSQAERIFTNAEVMPSYYGGNGSVITFASVLYDQENRLRNPDTPNDLSNLNVQVLPISVNLELDFVNNVETDVFSIWVLLVRPKNKKTMYFFREPKTTENLRTLTQVTGADEGKIDTTYNISGSWKPSIESDKVAYSYDMEEGDAFRFNGKFVPHLGTVPDKSYRLSVETRYPYLESGFDLNSVFQISPDGTTLLVRTLGGNNTPSVEPPYLPLTIYKYFQDEFSLISQQYNRLKGDGGLSPRILRLEESDMISMRIFQNVLDNVPFQDYKWIPVIDPQTDMRAPIIQRGWNNPGVEAFLTSD